MRNPIETILGGVILIFALTFLIFGYIKADVRKVNGYDVKVTFAKVGGIIMGDDVKINGIKIGTVTGIHLDPVDYNAILHLSIKDDIVLPMDTWASIETEGIIGGKYVNLSPGNDSKTISRDNKGEIRNVKNFKSLEDMVSEVIFSMTGQD